MKRIKFVILFIALLITSTKSIYAQEKTNLNSALDKLTQASLSKNSHEIIKYTSPRLIKVMGGRESAIAFVKEGFSMLNSQFGIKIDTVINFNKMRISKQGFISYKFIPQILIMSIPDKEKKMISITNLLALKENTSSDWKFIDTNNPNPEFIYKIIPEFKNKVKIPYKLPEKPLVIPKEELQSSIQSLVNILDENLNNLPKEINQK